MTKKITVSAEEQLAEIKVGCSEIIAEEELLAKLKRSYAEQKPLRIKLGADPSSPDIHLGHTVVLNKLRLFQNFGHHVIFIIGDFTARIGDPTGKNKTRPPLSSEQVLTYARTYQDQIFRVLDSTKTEVVYNSAWLDKLSPMDMVRLMASRTVQQIMVRDDFAKRMEENVPVHLHELLYPILQGYDSVHLRSDVELGGTDQKFNLLFAREMQRHAGQEAQCTVTVPLLEGLDGVQKMSKSLNNYIGISEAPREIFGKTMSISDELMVRFYELLSRKGYTYVKEVKSKLKDGTLHPMEAKKNIAQEIVEHYWGEAEAKAARKHFEETFSNRKTPSDIPVHKITLDAKGCINVIDLCMELGFCQSRSEARRLLKQNGLHLDSKTVDAELQSLEAGKEYVFKQGKLKMAKLQVS